MVRLGVGGLVHVKMRSNSIIMAAAAVVIRWLWGHISGNKSYDNQLTCYAAGLHH